MNFDKLPEENEAPAPLVNRHRLRRWVWLLTLGLALAAAGIYYRQQREEASDSERAARLAAVREKELRLVEVTADLAKAESDGPGRLRLAKQGLMLVEEIARLRPGSNAKDAARIFEW